MWIEKTSITVLPGFIRVGCKIEAVDFFVSGASHAQPAILRQGKTAEVGPRVTA